MSVYHINTFTCSDHLKMLLGRRSSAILMKRFGLSVKRGGGMFKFQTFPLRQAEDEQAAGEVTPVGNGKNVTVASSSWSREPHKGLCLFFTTAAGIIS